ncbi:MAG TPA: transposase [Bacteroidales bacterium]|nr:transposase [Bacteroidales bacterium]
MPRANRYYLQGNIWHITHRCHKKDFLLWHRRDRATWLHWLFEAKKRFDISVLNYNVTRNHVHLLVKDKAGEENISDFMQLLQSRVAQEYNTRKNRKGAFWEDRYHATAIDSDVYLMNCMTYINLNMVRAGVVKDPAEWKESGYSEIEFPRKRYGIIDFKTLLKELCIETVEELQKSQKDRINELLSKQQLNRESKWTESLAVGSEDFVERVKEQLDFRAKSRKIIKTENDYILSDSEIPYRAIFDPKNEPLRLKNGQ